MNQMVVPTTSSTFSKSEKYEAEKIRVCIFEIKDDENKKFTSLKIIITVKDSTVRKNLLSLIASTAIDTTRPEQRLNWE